MKLAYGLGAMAFGIKDQGFNALLMLYYNQVIGLPAGWVGLAIGIATLVDAFSDPVIGHFSDHLHSRWGRRHPFMYGSALPITLGYLLLWGPPSASHEVLFAWLLVTSIVVRVGISAYEIPSNALIAEFSNDYDERTNLSTWRALFIAVGNVGMTIVVFKLFLRPTAEQPVGQLNAAGYLTYSYVAAALMLTAVLTSALGTHRRIAFLQKPLASDHVGFAGLLSGLKTLFTDRAYASVIACMFFFSIATGLAITLNVYVATYFWRINADQLAALGGGAALGVLLALAVAPPLAKRFGKKSMCIGLYSLALAGCCVPVALGLLGIMPREISRLLPWLILGNAIVIGSIIGGVIMGTSMIADTADHIALKTGRRMEGLMASALVMINKGVSGMGVFLSGIVLTAIGFPEKAAPDAVPPEVVTHLATIYLIGMASLVGLAIVSIFFYPITRAMHEQTLQQLGKAAVAT
jgi:Na+/melibiose symporter-like transporter